MNRSSALRAFVVAVALAGAAFSLYGTATNMAGLAQLPGEVPRGVIVGALAVFGLGSPAAALLVLALAWRSWHRPEARALALFLAPLAYVLGSDGVWIALRAADLPLVVTKTVDVVMPLLAILGLWAVVRFSTVFPHPLGPAALAPPPPSGGVRAAVPALVRAGQRWTLRPAATARIAAAVAAVGILAPQVWMTAAEMAGREPPPFLTVTRPLMTALVATAILLSALNLRAGYAGADAAGRRRVFWVLEGFVAAAAIILVASGLKVLEMVTGWRVPLLSTYLSWYPLAMVAAFLALLACLAIAMFASGALDPALAVRRTAIVGALGVTLLVLLATAEQVLQDWLGARLGLSDRAGGVLTGASVALGMEVARKRVAPLVDRALARMDATPAAGPEPATDPAAPRTAAA